MKVSIAWLKELVNLNISLEELITLLPMRVIGLKETTHDFIELDMKGYNRADLLSMRGVAREVAAITNSKVKFKTENKYIWDGKSLPKVKVEVQDSNLCPLYCVAKIEGLKVKSSVKDWVKKLADCGIRSVDNVTDITNLMMLEYGQTMHAFDAAKVTNETMVIRLAREDEKFVTLDGKTRTLTKEDLLIADPDGILSLSGIMGGKDCEITENTHTILLEVAIFDPASIRKSSQRFGLYSEASKRIQHGLTRMNLLQALSAAIKMYEEMGGKLTAITLTGNLTDELKSVQLTQEKINSLIGIKLDTSDVEYSLKSLGFHLEGVSTNVWDVIVPYWRLDINIEEDLVEEVARMYGYENIPPRHLKGELPEKIDQSLYELIYNLKSKLAKLGLTEIQTYSFYSTKVLQALGFNNERKGILIKVANPTSTETEYMRQNLWPNLVEMIDKNMRQGFEDMAIFEIGKVYELQKDGEVNEPYRLSIAVMNNSDNPLEELINISQKLSSHLEGVKLTHPKGVLMDDRNLFHPVRFTPNMAEVHLRILNKLGIDKRVAIFEIDIQSLR